MIHLKQAIITEGRYDKAKLANIFDALIIEVGGFGIYKNQDKRNLIKKLAFENGIVIITDSDKAGFRIRSFIKNIASGGKIWDVYLPDIRGKEKRKTAPSKEGLLGAEGIDDEIIVSAFRRSGVEESAVSEVYSKAFLTEIGLCGGENSASLRKKLARELSLPANINANTLCRTLPLIMEKDELMELVEKLKK